MPRTAPLCAALLAVVLLGACGGDPEEAAAPAGPSAAASAPTGPAARCSDIEAVVAQWSPADRAFFDEVGGSMRVGGAVVAGTSFEAVYVPKDSGSGDPLLDRYTVGKGFETLDTASGLSTPLVDYRLDLSADPGGPVTCEVSAD